MTARNRLFKEKSPYLLQHQDNPVDWYPWCEEAFERARLEDKLIFLSIGYSTCHWCHVMAHESFEDESVAKLLNENFISIKVDREERSDIDHIYMTAVQALTGSGGWPLTVFLTPEKKPVTGGTYFPPEDRWGRPGMKTLLPRLANLWKTEKQDMLKASEQMTEILQRTNPTNLSWQPSEELLTKTYEQLEANYDSVYGGFGSAPKFPRSHDLNFLLRYYDRTRNEKALEMVSYSLEQIALGGIYDHLGGGFARYATDEKWLVPHFEKMLYDQAALVRSYAEAFQITAKQSFRDVIEEVYQYIKRDLTSVEGGFYSAEDADSEGEEGKFYVWDPEEIKAALGEADARVFCEFFQVTEAGNFEHEKTVLHLKESPESFAMKKGIDPKLFATNLFDWKEKLLQVRSARIRPHLDDKILAAWNGFMISSLAYAGRVLAKTTYIAAAEKAAEFIFNELIAEGRLYRRYRDGERSIPGFCDDYAFVIRGFMDLYEATYDLKWLEEAQKMTDVMIELFWDQELGAFFYTSNDAEPLIARHKEFYDGAIPSSNAIAAESLYRMGMITGENQYTEKSLAVLMQNAAFMEQSPVNFTQAMIAMDSMLGKNHEIVMAAGDQVFEQDPFARAIQESYLPRAILMLSDPHLSRESFKRFPLLREKQPVDHQFTAYVCEKFSCAEPVLDFEAFRKVVGAL